MSPLDRVARVLYRSNEPTNVPYEHIGSIRQNHWRGKARAVITALKYEDGTDEGTLIDVSNKHRVEAVSLCETYDAMLDAAAR